MIVSHRYRFIFLKTRKTAGTSIELALSRWLGPEDIITPVGPPPWDETYRRETGLMTARNYHKAARDIRPGDLPESLRIAFKKLTGQYTARPVWPMAIQPHMSAADARRVLGAEIWDGYFKFAVERNPWDFAVSLYEWKQRRRRRMSFNEYVARGYPARYANWKIYEIDGQPAVDRLLRFESLGPDLDAVSEHLGLPGRLSTAMDAIRAKSGVRRQAGYRDRFDPGARDRIHSQFHGAIEALDYTF